MMSLQASIFTHGCFYRNVGNSMMMSMFGSVTDAQVFSRELSDQEMIDITGCRSTETTNGPNKTLPNFI